MSYYEKILIIEDEEPIRELIKLNLTLAGFETLEACDGKEGLELINNEKIDLILLDIMLPQLDGYELLPSITAKNIPVIILTAKDGLKDKVKGLGLGADDYVTKPFEAMELIARIKAVLRRSDKKSGKYGLIIYRYFWTSTRYLKTVRKWNLLLKSLNYCAY